MNIHALDQDQLIGRCVSLFEYLLSDPEREEEWDEVDDIFVVVLVLNRLGYSALRTTSRLSSTSGITYSMDAVELDGSVVFNAQGVRGWGAINQPVLADRTITKVKYFKHNPQDWLSRHEIQEQRITERRVGLACAFWERAVLTEALPATTVAPSVAPRI